MAEESLALANSIIESWVARSVQPSCEKTSHTMARSSAFILRASKLSLFLSEFGRSSGSSSEKNESLPPRESMEIISLVVALPYCKAIEISQKAFCRHFSCRSLSRREFDFRTPSMPPHITTAAAPSILIICYLHKARDLAAQTAGTQNAGIVEHLVLDELCNTAAAFGAVVVGGMGGGN